jgi:putative acyl-CoA dehydrogenase
LIEQSLMQNVLADLVVESGAATLLAFRLAGACDRAEHVPLEMFLKRIGTAVGKYWVTKRGPMHVAESLECLGGNGYVEESILPRLYREAPLNSIWEGSGNVNCLDVLRSFTKNPQSLELFEHIFAPVQHIDKRLDAAVLRLQQELKNANDLEWRARQLVEQMALVLQGTLLVQYGPPAIADAFCASRLSGDWGHAFGTLPAGLDVAAILDYALS